MTLPIDFRVLRPPVAGPGPATKPHPPRTTGNGSFAEMLSGAEGRKDVTFSAHASERLARRGISLTEDDKRRLSEAVSAVQEKGGRNSLVLMGNTALIVNVPNRTVVTALGAGTASERVITNIDSAVIS